MTLTRGLAAALPLALAACAVSGGAHALPGQDAAGASDEAILPDWHGVWRGKLTSLPPRSGATALVTLEIDAGSDPADGCLTWRSTFTSENHAVQVKDYRLCRLADGRHVIDEGRGLELEVFVYDDVMYSAFETHGVTLFSVHRLQGDTMHYDIFVTRGESEPVPGVHSYKGQTVQRTVFQRVAAGTGTDSDE